MLLHNDSIPSITAKLPEGAFSSREHQLLYKVIADTYSQKKAVDAVLIKDALGARVLDVGGASYIASLLAASPEASTKDQHIQTVWDKWQIRRAVDGATALIEKAKDGGSILDLKQCLEKLQFARSGDERGVINSLCEETIASLGHYRKTGADLFTGFKDLDDTTGGLRRGCIYTVGGKTSHGKTTFAINVALNNLLKNPNTRVLYNAFEDIEQIPLRLASMKSHLHLDWFLKPHLIQEDEYSRLTDALTDLAQYKDRLVIVNGVSVARMRALCDEYKTDIAIVDYIQRYAHKFNLSSEGRLSHEIGKAVSDIKDLSIDKQVATLVLSQFSRREESMRYRKPALEDLKESGDIENYSDNVILLWWKWRDNPKEMPNKYTILVEKNKLGPRSEHEVHIEAETLRLNDWAIRV